MTNSTILPFWCDNVTCMSSLSFDSLTRIDIHWEVYVSLNSLAGSLVCLCLQEIIETYQYIAVWLSVYPPVVRNGWYEIRVQTWMIHKKFVFVTWAISPEKDVCSIIYTFVNIWIWEWVSRCPVRWYKLWLAYDSPFPCLIVFTTAVNLW